MKHYELPMPHDFIRYPARIVIFSRIKSIVNVNLRYKLPFVRNFIEIS